jgi:hypothetical protein
MTMPQSTMVGQLLEHFRSDIFEANFHHGNCVGADEEAAAIARYYNYVITAYPADLTKWQSDFKSDFYKPVTGPLTRNRAIVKDSDVIIAAPNAMMEPLVRNTRGSGTWYTIRHARKKERKCVIVWRDGGVKWENE